MNQPVQEIRHSERYSLPRLEVEWRVVDGGLYRKSKLLNFSNGGLAIVSPRPLQPEQKLAFRVRLPGGVSYLMGRVRHSVSEAQGESVVGVMLEFCDPREESKFANRVHELKTPRRSHGSSRL